MSRTAAARRERFLPYRYARGGLDADVRAVTLDGETVVTPEPDARVVALDFAWTRAELALTVRVPSETVARVAPEGTRLDALAIAIVLRSPATLLRRAVRLPVRALDAPLEASLALDRDELAGAVELRALLVRARAARSAGGYATLRGARLADARSWELRVDRGREPRGEHLDVRYRRFSEDEVLPPRDRQNVYVLDADEETPILWLNAEHERVTAILDSRGTVGRQARLREVFFDLIAHSVWTQLFLRAATDLARADETLYPWQDAVLDLLLRDVFPEVRRAADRRERLVELHREDLPALLARLDAGLQRRHDLGAHLTRLADEEHGK